MVADAFNNCAGTAVSHSKPLCRNAANIGFTRGSTIKVYVTGNDIFFCLEGALLGWIENNLASGESFADIVVGVAFNSQCDALG